MISVITVGARTVLPARSHCSTIPVGIIVKVHGKDHKPAPPRTLGALEALYRQYNRPEYVYPDPLALVLRFHRPEDQETAGLIAAALAFGNVVSILRSVQTVLDALPRPAHCLQTFARDDLEERLNGFRHRYVSSIEMVDLLAGMQRVVLEHGSLGQCFRTHLRPEHETVLPALIGFTDALRAQSGLAKNYLLPDPRRGSACKRWLLYLRWMIRRDAVDPGPWRHIPAAKLLCPVDTHIHRIALRLGWTRRRNADLRTAQEITAVLRAAAPDDPVRYDFALARLGIYPGADMEAFFAQCEG